MRFRVSCPDDVARRVRCLEDRLPNFFHQEPPETSPGPLLSCTQAGVSPNFLAPSPPSHELAVNVTGSAVVLPLLTALWLAQRCAAMPPSFAVNSRRLPVPGFYTSAQGSLYKPNNRPFSVTMIWYCCEGAAAPGTAALSICRRPTSLDGLGRVDIHARLAKTEARQRKPS